MRSTALLSVFSVFALASGCTVTVDDEPGSRQQAALVSSDLVLADVYGGGGNSGAAFTHDYVVLFNRGTATASTNGLRLTYGSSTGNFATGGASVVDLPTADVPAGGSFLVRLASGGNSGTAITSYDATGSINLSGSAGKIALTTTTGGLGTCGDASTPCDPAKWIDLVGWGTGTTQAEGTKAGNTAVSTGLRRGALGCIDTGDNANDFSVVTPTTPRDSSTTATPCSSLDLAGVDLATSADLAHATDLAGADLASSSNVLLNEVKWNPAGADNGQEFIELIGSGTIASNTWVLSVEGDANSTAGRINYALNVGGKSFGSNGLLLIKGSTSTIAGVAAATTVVTDAVFNGAPLQNGTESLLLVYSASALSITPGTTNFSSLTVSILDSIAARADATGTVYGGAAFAACPATGGSAVDGAYRTVGDARAQTLGAWIGGQAVGNATDQYLSDVTACSGGGPATAVMSPGRPNDDPFMSPPDLAGPVDLAMTPDDLSGPEPDLATPDLAVGHSDLSAPVGDASSSASDMAKPRTIRESGCAMAPGPSSPLAIFLIAALAILLRRRARRV